MTDSELLLGLSCGNCNTVSSFFVFNGLSINGTVVGRIHTLECSFIMVLLRYGEADLAQDPVLEIQYRLVRCVFKFKKLFVTGLHRLVEARLVVGEQFAMLLLENSHLVLQLTDVDFKFFLHYRHLALQFASECIADGIGVHLREDQLTIRDCTLLILLLSLAAHSASILAVAVVLTRQKDH